MASLCTRIGEWLRSPFSAVVTFQKRFVDDVAERVKHEKERLDRKAREMQQRATQLHLDKLEEKYLCCVCGKSGESREDDEYVYDTFALVTLPSSRTLTRAMARADEAAVARRRGGSGATTNLTTRLRRASVSAAASKTITTAAVSADDDEVASSSGSDDDDNDDKSGNAATSTRHAHITTTTTTTTTTAAAAAARADGVDAAHVTDEAVQELMYKVRHAVLNKEARTRRRCVAVHKDKGLMMIDDADVDLFSCFFQRPVHGYLCVQCYTSVRKRLDLLTRQIETILYKGKHALLRKVPAAERRRVLQHSSSRVAPLLMRDVHAPDAFRDAPDPTSGLAGVQAVADDDDDDDEVTHDTDSDALSRQQQHPRHRRRRSGDGDDDGAACVVWRDGDDRSPRNRRHDTAVLSDACILDLRAHVRCDVCQRHLCAFFVRRSVLFLCAFCCARDRYYRDHAVCINDEPMPAECAHLLRSLSEDAAQRRQQQQQQQQQGQHAARDAAARTSLFRHTNMATVASSSSSSSAQRDRVVLCGVDKDTVTADAAVTVAAAARDDTSDEAVDLFALLQPPTEQMTLRVRPALPHDSDDAAMPTSSVSLFTNTQLERTPAVDLFAVNAVDGRPT